MCSSRLTPRASGSRAARRVPVLLVALALGATAVRAGPPEAPSAAKAAFPAPGAWVPTPAGEGFDLVYLVCEAGGRARFGIATTVALLSVVGTWSTEGETLALEGPRELAAQRYHWTATDAGGLALRKLDGERTTDQPLARAAAPQELCRTWADADAKVELELRPDHVCRWREAPSQAPTPRDRMGVWFAADVASLGLDGPSGPTISVISGGPEGMFAAFRYALSGTDALRLEPASERTFLRDARTLRAGASAWTRLDGSAVTAGTRDPEAPEGVWLAVRRGTPTGEALRVGSDGRFTREADAVAAGTWRREGGVVRLAAAPRDPSQPAERLPDATGAATVGDDGALSVAWGDGARAEPVRYERARTPAAIHGRWRVEGDPRSQATFDLRAGGSLTWDDGDLSDEGTPRPPLVGTWQTWGDTLVLAVVTNGERRAQRFSLPFVRPDRMLCDAGGMGMTVLLVRAGPAAPR